MVETEPQRTVETAIVRKPNDGRLEYLYTVSARELIKTPERAWYLRDRAAEHRDDPATGLRITCLMCGEPLYVSARRHGGPDGKKLPLLSHHTNSTVPCPWHSGQNLSPDQVRALQYGGRQESELHARLCEIILEAARADPQYFRGAVDTYRKPQVLEEEHGRYPDVLVEWEDRDTTVFEIQLSRTLPPEILGRERHYGKERVNLLWLMYGIDPRTSELPQAFDDIIRRHRGSAFVVDQASIEASNERSTVVLSCYLKGADGQFEAPRLVTLDDLKYPARGLPFLEDRITKTLVASSREAQRRWSDILKKLPWDWRYAERVPDLLQEEIAALKAKHGSLSDSLFPDEVDYTVTVLIALCITIATQAAKGDNTSYVTRPMPMANLLNTVLQHESFGMQRYVTIIEHFIDRTVLAGTLPPSVYRHIKRVQEAMSGNLCRESEPEWWVVTGLFPEIFDARVREQLIYLDSLPRWARPEVEPVIPEDEDVI